MNRPHMSLTGAVVLVFAAACARNPSDNAAPAQAQPPIAIDDTLRIPLGRQAVTRDGGLRLTFVRLEADSRCPTNVVCVWQGDAAVRLSGSSAAGAIEAAIHTTLEPRTFDVNGYTIHVLDVLPHPGSGSAQPPSVVARVVRNPAA